MSGTDGPRHQIGKWFNITVNLTAFSVMVIAVLHPKGLVVTSFRESRERAHQRDTIAAAWNELAGNASQEESSIVVEFLDYQCPFCRMGHDSIVSAQGKKKFQLIYKNLPLPGHPAAEGAARATICAEHQGRFEAMHDRLITTTAWQENQRWSEEAVAAGVTDTLEFLRCLNSKDTDGRLASDLELAGRLGIRSTPFFVSLAGLHRGLPTVEELFDLAQD